MEGSISWRLVPSMSSKPILGRRCAVAVVAFVISVVGLCIVFFFGRFLIFTDRIVCYASFILDFLALCFNPVDLARLPIRLDFGLHEVVLAYAVGAVQSSVLLRSPHVPCYFAHELVILVPKVTCYAFDLRDAQVAVLVDGFFFAQELGCVAFLPVDLRIESLGIVFVKGRLDDSGFSVEVMMPIIMFAKTICRHIASS